MSARHDLIGIKQILRLDWLEKTTNLLFAGMEGKYIRKELHDFLGCQKSCDAEGERSEQTRTFAVNNLMKIWVSPESELVDFRNAALALLRKQPSMALAIHWAVISAAYPFWFNVARQTGRLLNLQDQVTQQQIANRLKEQYGDRQTISRYARYVIRSFVEWGVLKDAETKGCYEKAAVVTISDQNLAILMLEAALQTSPEGKGALGLLLNNPAFFPFSLPVMSGDLVTRQTDRIDVVRYGMDDEMLKLKM
ncbi:MAG: hypothetical protein PHN84_08025 [Desulfuromonadaceae bacterium]|nr:hypothetical protein [Desulfuromonadaceae bacterium]MDD2856434.1 hypothetical protein [Desulfuromonadaceae bacterium]